MHVAGKVDSFLPGLNARKRLQSRNASHKSETPHKLLSDIYTSQKTKFSIKYLFRYLVNVTKSAWNREFGDICWKMF